MPLTSSSYKKGDTIIEVLLAFVVFSLVAIAALSIMNQGVNSVQGSLESTLARAEITTQAEALRFLHSAYTAELKITNPSSQQYTTLWKVITESAVGYSEVPNWGTCDPGDRAFAINPRGLNTILQGSHDTSEYEPGALNNILAWYPSAISGIAKIYPRIIYNSGAPDDDDDSGNAIEQGAMNLSSVEGIWVVAVESQEGKDVIGGAREPMYYDFHVRACWRAPGDGDSVTSTLGTILRLYNPNGVDVDKCDSGYFWDSDESRCVEPAVGGAP